MSNSTAKKIITVFGATGKQGGSVARSLAQNPAFHVRGITRNPSSDSAKQLEALGIEVIKANGFNPEELKAAFDGAWGAFVNINSDDPELQKGTLELALGRNIADAALASGIHHIVFSGTVSTASLANMPIPMYDNKAAVQAHISSLPFPASSFIMAGWYMENQLDPGFAQFAGGFPFFQDEEGWTNLKLPRWGPEGGDGVPFVAMAEDFGDIVHGIFLDPEAEGVKGKMVHGASQELHYDEWLKIFSEVTGKKARYIEIPHSEIVTHGMKELEELAGLLKFCDFMDGRYFGEKLEMETPERLKRLVQKRLGKEETGLSSWRSFVEKHKEEFSKVL